MNRRGAHRRVAQTAELIEDIAIDAAGVIEPTQRAVQHIRRGEQHLGAQHVDVLELFDRLVFELVHFVAVAGVRQGIEAGFVKLGLEARIAQLLVEHVSGQLEHRLPAAGQVAALEEAQHLAEFAKAVLGQIQFAHQRHRAAERIRAGGDIFGIQMDRLAERGQFLADLQFDLMVAVVEEQPQHLSAGAGATLAEVPLERLIEAALFADGLEAPTR